MTKTSDNIFIKTSPNGTVQTYVNAKLHSINGEPSKHRKIMGEYSWHKEGKLHREEDQPAVIRDYEYEVRLKNEKVTLEEKEWYLKGKRHRDGDKPAMIIKKTVVYLDHTKIEIEKRWYIKGKNMRLGDKPAIVRTNEIFNNETNFLTSETHDFCYINKGEVHRDGDKPAVIVTSKKWDDNHKLIQEDFTKKWYLNNKYHREGDKPAILMELVTYKSEKRILTYLSKWYYKAGLLHRENDKPAVKETRYHSNGNTHKTIIKFYKDNLLHRERDKPAVIFFEYEKDGNTILCSSEKYYIEDLLHRENDKPAVISDFEGDKVTAYLKNGELDREANPAIFARYENEFYFQFYNQGKIVKPGDKSYIANELLKYDSSLDIDLLKTFPGTQLLSMLNTLSVPAVYSMEVPVTYINDIKNEF